MPTLLTSARYPAVRAAIAVDLTAVELPDATIALDLYAGRARRAVLARVPTAESLSGDDDARVQAAAVLLCAAELIGALPQITGEDDGTLSTTRKATDPAARAAALRQAAEAELAALLTPDDATPARPPVFATAPGRRGR